MQSAIFAIFETFNKLMFNFLNKYLSEFGQAIKHGYKTNAFAPLKWLIIFLILPLLSLIFFSKNEFIQDGAFVFMIALVSYGCIMYFKLFKKDPKLLQSEWYRLEEQKINMYSEKGGEIKFVDVDLTKQGQIGGNDNG